MAPSRRGVHAAPDRARGDLRRPSRGRHRECPAVQRDAGGAGAADGLGRNLTGDLEFADRRAAGVRRHCTQRHRLVRGDQRHCVSIAGRPHPSRGTSQPVPEAISLPATSFPVPLDRGTASGRAILDRAVVHIHDIAADAGYSAATLVKTGLRSVLSVPMLRSGETIGSINVSRGELRPFSDRQIELLKTFADQAVIAIENVRLFDQVQAKTRDLEESLAAADRDRRRVEGDQPLGVRFGHGPQDADRFGAVAERRCDSRSISAGWRDAGGSRGVRLQLSISRILGCAPPARQGNRHWARADDRGRPRTSPTCLRTPTTPMARDLGSATIARELVCRCCATARWTASSG